MAFIVNTYKGEAELQAAIGGDVQVHKSSDDLDAFINALTTETLTQAGDKGMYTFTVTDADVSPNTLSFLYTTGYYYIVIEETP